MFAIARLTNLLLFYTLRTTAMEPSITLNENIFLSKLVPPARFDVIAFNHNDSLFGNVNWVYRICGMPGDEVEIRNGVLYVNGANADSGLQLKQEFLILNWQAEEVEKNEDNIRPANHDDSSLVNTTAAAIEEKGFVANRFTLPRDYADPNIVRIYQQPWNQDHFGPVKVPEGKYFLLGDNRHHANDSRYIGFVGKDRFRGTLIW